VKVSDCGRAGNDYFVISSLFLLLFIINLIKKKWFECLHCYTFKGYNVYIEWGDGLTHTADSRSRQPAATLAKIKGLIMKKYIKKDHAQEFTDLVISMLESGKVAPWRKPWSSANGYCNAITKHSYTGVNVFMLMLSAEKNGFSSPYWATYKQVTEAGGQVIKGSKGTTITFYKSLEIEDETAADGKKFVPMRKFFTVFNLDQIEGLEIAPETSIFAEKTEDERKTALENHLFLFAEKAGIDYKVEGDRAYYSPVADLVKMPTNFKDLGGYCGTLTHEFIHSTGHKSRLDRFKDTAGISTKEHREEYAKEELVAELGAGLLCGMFGITSELENHVSYLASWLKALKNDKEFIFKAASAAQKAINFIADAVAAEEEQNAEKTA